MANNNVAYGCTTHDTQRVCYAIKGNFIDRDTRQNGIGWRNGEMYTLDATDKHGVCFPEIARTLCAIHDSSPCVDMGQNVVCVQNTGRGWWNHGEIAETLRTPCGGDALKANLVVYGVDCRNATLDREMTHTMQAHPGGGFSLNCTPSVVYDARGNGDGDLAHMITGDHECRVTDYTAICCGNGQLHQTELGDKIGALNCMHDQQAVITTAKPPRKYIVRRLTPLECCRLQGFPDWWEDGVEGSDSARYKMWGNGIALPCAYDVLRRIAKEANDGAHTAEL